MQAERPRITAMLERLEPIMFPREIPELPTKFAYVLTTSSGKDVPKATTVSPITRGETPLCSARSDAPSTRKSAPFTRTIRDAIKTHV